jgi:septum formation protein
MSPLALPPGTKLVLASASPRRRELLTIAGLPHEVRPASIPEIRGVGEDPVAYVERLAREKAHAVAAADDEIVIGADTTVVVDGQVLEKPADAADARRMLAQLSGRTHLVHTGICLRQRERMVSAVETTRVTFKGVSEAEIEAYIATGEPMDKAGAYAIQGIAARWIPHLEGCYFNVVGLPLARVWVLLKGFVDSPK